MAQTGYIPIQLYYSSTAGHTPVAGNLTNGELALNIADGKLFYKDSGGTVQVLATSASVTNVSSITFGTTGLTPSTATTGAVTVAGTLKTSNGGTNLTSFTSGGILYASSTSALTTGSTLNYNGTTLKVASASSAIDIGLTGDTTYHYFRTIDNAGQSIYVGNDNAAGSFFSAGAYGRVIYSEGANPIHIYTAATKRMMIGATGGVSIGNTTDPGATNLSVTGSTTSASFIPSSSTVPTNGMYLPAANSVGIATNSTLRATFDASGNLGIATASPTEKLEISGNAAVTGIGYLALQRQLIPVGQNGVGSLDFRWYSTGTTYVTGARIGATTEAAWSSTSAPARLEFYTTASGSTTSTIRATIDSSGNIYGTSGTTGMANGFFYIPSAAGAPSGTPTAVSGRVPMYYDTTNNKFYIYNGAWKSVTLA